MVISWDTATIIAITSPRLWSRTRSRTRITTISSSQWKGMVVKEVSMSYRPSASLFLRRLGVNQRTSIGQLTPDDFLADFSVDSSVYPSVDAPQCDYDAPCRLECGESAFGYVSELGEDLRYESFYSVEVNGYTIVSLCNEDTAAEVYFSKAPFEDGVNYFPEDEFSYEYVNKDGCQLLFSVCFKGDCARHSLGSSCN